MSHNAAQRALTDYSDAREAFREALRGGNADEISFAQAQLEAAKRALSDFAEPRRDQI